VDFLKAQFYAMSGKSSAKSLSTADGFNELASNFSQTGYEEAIQQILEYISAGDVYQVNLSQRFQVPFSGDTFALFSHLYQENPAPFFAYVQAGDHQIVSTSPERFLLRSGSRIEARPIKGTMPRGKTASEDQDMRQALISSTKDDAELSMIVDLLRNDIGKVCAPFSVHVAEHKRMEAYQNVFHQVSIVEGKLDSDKDTVDLITATFPGGSITGCPKIRAMEIIDELESHRRHVYCGSIGYLSFHDTMDLSIAIRTATVVNNTLSFSVGGGIVFDSIPTSEYEETLHKGKTLIEACLRGA
jgi:para-aminobenzoate synthetase component 1